MVFLTVLVSAAGAFFSSVGEGDRLGKVGTPFVTSGEGAGEEHPFIAKVARIGMRMVLVFIYCRTAKFRCDFVVFLYMVLA